jgi:membrane associated rhomboid family serine protease
MRPENVSFSFPKPGKGLVGVMLFITVVWVALAVGGNYADADIAAITTPFVGSTARPYEVWRLVTATFIHDPSGPGSPGHLVTTLLGLYFLGTPLEERWGTRRTLFFLIGSAAFAFFLQTVAGLVPWLAKPTFYGGLGMVEAVAVAWALSARGQTVRLFFVLPVTPMMLVAFIFIMSVLNLLARNQPQEGLVTPFGGMLAGYLFADGSPLRRWWLGLRLKKLQQQTAQIRAQSSKSRAGGPPLRVIHGGGKDPPKDKRFLN